MRDDDIPSGNMFGADEDSNNDASDACVYCGIECLASDKFCLYCGKMNPLFEESAVSRICADSLDELIELFCAFENHSHYARTIAAKRKAGAYCNYCGIKIPHPIQ